MVIYLVNRKFPPKGYRALEFPLVHTPTPYKGKMSLFNPSNTCVFITLCKTTNDNNAPDTIETHPNNVNFAEETGVLIKMGSIVERIRGNIHLALTKEALATDNINALYTYLIPVYGSYKTNWEMADKKLGTTIAQILHMTKDDTKEDIVPEHNVVDVKDSSNHPFATINKTEVRGDWDLTTADSQEYIGSTGFLDERITDAYSYYSNGMALKNFMGKWIRFTLTRDKTYASMSLKRLRWPRKYRRGVEYLIKGFFLWTPEVGHRRQLVPTSAVTNIGHVYYMVSPEYDEWHHGHNSEEI